MSKSHSYLARIINLTLASAASLSMGSPASAAEDNAYLLEEVLVTAQKREEALADIPMSITVLGGGMLEKDVALDFEDLVPLVPGLSVTGSTPGVTRITLRGINTGGVASTVGVYVGDVPFGSSSGLANGAVLSGDFDTFDLARIEVLRGPQGTLYGASSLGGVFKYIPNLPSTEGFEARVKGGMETVKYGDIGYAFTGMVNTPISDTLALRASGFYRNDGGYINSIGNNPIPSLTDPSVNVIDGTQVNLNLNSSETYGGRVQALWTPTEDFSLNLMALLQDINSDAPDVVDANQDTLKPIYDVPVQSRYQDQWTDISYRIYSATADWNFDWANLQSVSSYGTFDQDFQVDAAIAAGLTGGTPLSSLISYIFGQDLSAILPQTTSTDKFTQEFRLISPESDKLEWLVGAYYTDEDSLIDQEILAVYPGTENIAEGIPVLAVASVSSKYQEIAAFANATWYVTPDFELGFGGRISNNDQKATQTTSGPLAGGATTVITGESSETPFTWSFAPRYQLDEDSSIYGRIATGFRPGGPNILPPGAPPGTPASYDSDSLTSYEFGLKTAGTDGKFILDASLFYLDWNDIQLYAVVNGFGVNTNGGTAISEGLEFSTSYFPLEGLSFTLNGAFTNAKLTQDTSPEVGGMDGDPLPFVPRWSFGLLGNYEWTVGDNSTAYVGGTIGYTGDRPAGFSDTGTDGSQYELPAFTTLDLRAGMETGRWAFEIFAKNLTNELGLTSVDNANTIYTGYVEAGLIRPQTFGFSVAMQF